MEIRDPVHGSIHISKEEIPLLTHKFFQRLRNIKQLGLSEYVFPGATHTRFLHSIGVRHISTLIFDRLFKDFSDPKIKTLRETLKLACMLHDIGHAPLSHATESVMPKLKELGPNWKEDQLERQATHEDYTLKIILDSSFTGSFHIMTEQFGVKPLNVASLIKGDILSGSDDFIINQINYFPLLHQLVSSELDADRMDYLLRDSYYCGVSYGQFDLDWLVDNLAICTIKNEAHLGISERAVVTFDDFLLSRYHMFVMVYFHYRSVCLEQLMLGYFQTCNGEYAIPGDIESYLDFDDHHLTKVLRSSNHPKANKIINNQIPPKIFESFNEHQLIKLSSIQRFLEDEGIEYIRCSSSGRLSKYYQSENEKYSLKVVRKLYSDQVHYSHIDQATDLFEKFSKAHAINRLHCYTQDISEKQLDHIKKLTISDKIF